MGFIGPTTSCPSRLLDFPTPFDLLKKVKEKNPVAHCERLFLEVSGATRSRASSPPHFREKSHSFLMGSHLIICSLPAME